MKYKLNWSDAAKYGLILASASVVINLAVDMLTMPAILTVLLTALKFCASVYIVYFAMCRNTASWGSATYGQSFGFGTAVCFFSAIICTLFKLLTYTVFIPGYIPEALNGAYAMLESMNLPSYSVPDYDTMMKALPAYLAITLINYHIIIGLIVSAITAAFAKKTENDPFNGQTDNSIDNTEE